MKFWQAGRLGDRRLSIQGRETHSGKKRIRSEEMQNESVNLSKIRMEGPTKEGARN